MRGHTDFGTVYQTISGTFDQCEEVMVARTITLIIC